MGTQFKTVLVSWGYSLLEELPQLGCVILGIMGEMLIDMKIMEQVIVDLKA